MSIWIGLAAAIGVVIAIAAASTAWVVSSISRERVSALTTLNPAGSAGRALVVYHPGLGDFPERTVSAFAEGLVQSGWAVDRTTASREAPTRLGDYDLVVVSSPIYGGRAAKPLDDYIARVGDFGAKRVAIVLTGAGDTAAALDATVAAVKALRGNVIARLAYTTMRPNESPRPYAGTNVEIALQMARDAARALALTPAE